MRNTEGASYKYLTEEQRRYVDGLHESLDAMLDLVTGVDGIQDSSIKEDVTDCVLAHVDSDDLGCDRGEYLSAYDKVGDDVIAITCNMVYEAVESRIEDAIVGFASMLDDYDARQAEVDQKYAELELTPDMTLIDDFGYNVGVIKSVDAEKQTCIVVSEDTEIFEDMSVTETDDGYEGEMTFDAVKSFCLRFPVPMLTEYVNGEVHEHYKFGGEKVSSVE